MALLRLRGLSVTFPYAQAREQATPAAVLVCGRRGIAGSTGCGALRNPDDAATLPTVRDRAGSLDHGPNHRATMEALELYQGMHYLLCQLPRRQSHCPILAA
jgi:hypothetical protein